MTMGEQARRVLIVSPTPAFPASAGNRQRVRAVAAGFAEHGYAVDFAYLSHEDEIYRALGALPPTDLARCAQVYGRVFLVEPKVGAGDPKAGPSAGTRVDFALK